MDVVKVVTLDSYVKTSCVIGDKLIYSLCKRCELYILDLRTGITREFSMKHPGEPQCISSYNGNIITGSDDNNIYLWDIDTETLLKCFQGHTLPIKSVNINAGKIISGSYDKTIHIWDIDTGLEEACLRGHENRISSIICSDNRIISYSYGVILIWNMNGKLERQLNIPNRNISTMFVHKNKIYIGNYIEDTESLHYRQIGCSIQVWNMDTGIREMELIGHDRSIVSIDVYHDQIVSYSYTGKLHIWNADGGYEKKSIVSNSLTTVGAISHHKNKIITCLNDCVIRVWNFENDMIEKYLKGHTESVQHIHTNDDYIVSISCDKTIRIWSTIERGKLTKRAR